MKKIPASLFIYAILFSACKKDKPNNILGTTNDSVLLSQYIELDTSGSIIDTISTTIFSYDNAGRNTSITLTYYDTGMPSNEQYHSQFAYNGTDTFPATQTVTTTFPDNEPHYANDLYYYKYANGQVVYDSIIQRSSSSVIRSYIVDNYTYFNEDIMTTGVAFYYDSMAALYVESDFSRASHIQKSKGNIIQQVDTSDNLNTDSYLFSYDANPNPFFKTQNKLANKNQLSNSYQDYPYYTTDEPRIPDGFGKNNITEINAVSNGGLSVYHSYYKYEYNANGYPSKVRYTSAGNSQFPIVGVFVYNK